MWDIPATLDRRCYRYPYPLVDAVLEHDPGRRVKAVKNVSVDEDFFQGHFPGEPLMPGVLMIETMAQVATSSGPVVQMPAKPNTERSGRCSQ